MRWFLALDWSGASGRVFSGLIESGGTGVSSPVELPTVGMKLLSAGPSCKALVVRRSMSVRVVQVTDRPLQTQVSPARHLRIRGSALVMEMVPHCNTLEKGTEAALPPGLGIHGHWT